MSRYTMSFMDILSGNPSDENIEEFRKKLFDFDYNFYSDEHKKFLETQFIRHYIEYDIGQSTMGLFKFYLKSYFQMEVGTYYNELYKANDLLKPYENSGYVRTTNGTLSDNTTSKITDEGTVDSNIKNNATGNSTTGQSGTTHSNVVIDSDVTFSNDTTSHDENVETIKGSQTSSSNDSNTSETKGNTSSSTKNSDTNLFGIRNTIKFEYPAGDLSNIAESSGSSGTRQNDYTDTKTTIGSGSSENSQNNTNTGNSSTKVSYSDDYADKNVNDSTSRVNTSTNDKTKNVADGNTTDTSTTNSKNDSTSESKQTSSSTRNDERSSNGTNDTTETIIGLTTSKADEFKKYFDALRNIDKMVIESREARELFLLLY